MLNLKKTVMQIQDSEIRDNFMEGSISKTILTKIAILEVCQQQHCYVLQSKTENYQKESEYSFSFTTLLKQII